MAIQKGFGLLASFVLLWLKLTKKKLKDYLTKARVNTFTLVPAFIQETIPPVSVLAALKTRVVN